MNNVWHLVEEETPNLNEIVLILLRGKTPVIAKFTNIGFMDDGLDFENVTHWLRLPELPNEKR